VVTRHMQVERRTGKVRQPKTEATTVPRHQLYKICWRLHGKARNFTSRNFRKSWLYSGRLPKRRRSEM